VANEPDNDVAAAASVPLPTCTSAGPAGAGFTIKKKLVECVADAPVPVTVIGNVPVGVDEDVVTMIVELCPAVTEAGLNETVAPVGAPLALSPTVWADPLVTAVLTMLLAGAPGVTVAEPGEAEIAKSFVTGGRTLRVKVCCTDPAALEAVMVNVEADCDVAVPASVAVPLPLSVKLTPVGRTPLSDIDGVGEPVVVTVKEPATFVVKEVLTAEVMAGGVWTMSEKSIECWAETLVPVTVIGYVPAGVVDEVVMVI
jgi:hypothetical protein